MDAFSQSVSRCLNVEELSLQTEFRKIPVWSDGAEVSLREMMRKEWGVDFTDESFARAARLRDLWCEAFISFAATLFEVPREQLGISTSMGSIPQWDSVNHLRLVMEAEARFGISYPFEKIVCMKELGDFLPC